MIRLEDIHAAYGARRVLHGVSLDVRPGETLSLVGPNSAGKSTLLKVMGGLLGATSGRVWLNARPLREWTLRERARTLAWVPSEADFVFSFTVEDVVLLGRTPHLPGNAPPTPADRAAVRRVLALTDLEPLAGRGVDTLSSGERQRVLLARALAQEPTVLLLDEPTAHLDVGHSRSFFRALTRLRDEHPLTVVLATHDLALAGRFSDRVALIRDGRLLDVGAPSSALTETAIQTLFNLEPEDSQ